MSDLSLPLLQAHSQLPVSSYFDPSLFQREQSRIFQATPRYVGHQLAIPAVGDYYALPQEAGGRALVQTSEGPQLISNVCRHRQAMMLHGRGSLLADKPGSASGNLVCPLSELQDTRKKLRTTAAILINQDDDRRFKAKIIW